MTDTNHIGLCGHCANARIIRSKRGSKFIMCQLHTTDPGYPRYPRLPVLRCAGYEPRDWDEEAEG